MFVRSSIPPISLRMVQSTGDSLMTGGHKTHNKAAAYMGEEVERRLVQDHGVTIDRAVIRQAVHAELASHKEGGNRRNPNVPQERWGEVIDIVVSEFASRGNRQVIAQGVETSDEVHREIETIIQNKQVRPENIPTLRTRLHAEFVSQLLVWGAERLEELDAQFRGMFFCDYKKRAQMLVLQFTL